MVQTKSGYKASGEPLTILQQHYRSPQAKETTSTMTNTDDQLFGQDDLATKVNKLTKQLESIMGWIQAQPPNQPKAWEIPLKETYNVSGYDDEDEDNDEDEDDDKKSKILNKTMKHGSHHPFKVKVKIDIPPYDGTVDAKKLDSWLDQLETYFTLYGFRSSDKEEASYPWEQYNSSDIDICRAFLKLCIVEDPIWEKISQELDEPIRSTHIDEYVCCQVQHMTEEKMYALRKEMREIHTNINNDLKVLTVIIEDIARVFLQDINEE
nr:hypothetical protein [Tanacetum cinerariifolium]